LRATQRAFTVLLGPLGSGMTTARERSASQTNNRDIAGRGHNSASEIHGRLGTDEIEHHVRATRRWTDQHRIAAMDAAGIDVQVLSLTAPSSSAQGGNSA
jgi:hypothetical protein